MATEYRPSFGLTILARTLEKLWQSPENSDRSLQAFSIALLYRSRIIIIITYSVYLNTGFTQRNTKLDRLEHTYFITLPHQLDSTI